MNLVMFISGIKIDSIGVDPLMCEEEGYLNAIKRLLKFRHQLTINYYDKNPTFYIEVPTSIQPA